MWEEHKNCHRFELRVIYDSIATLETLSYRCDRCQGVKPTIRIQKKVTARRVPKEMISIHFSVYISIALGCALCGSSGGDRNSGGSDGSGRFEGEHEPRTIMMRVTIRVLPQSFQDRRVRPWASVQAHELPGHAFRSRSLGKSSSSPRPIGHRNSNIAYQKNRSSHGPKNQYILSIRQPPASWLLR